MTLEQAADSFLTEARDILDALEEQLLALEADPNRDAIDAVFRALHTVKGSAGMFGFTPLAGFTHHFETAFERVRDGSVPVSSPLIGLSLRARDVMSILLEADARDAEAHAGSVETLALLEQLKAIVGETERRGVGRSPGGHSAPSAAAPAVTTVTYRPAADDLRNGARPDLLVAELAGLAERAEIECLAERVPPLDALDPTDAVLGFRVTLHGPVSRQAIEDVFLFADAADIAIVAAPEPAGSMPAGAKPGEPSVPGGGDAPCPPSKVGRDAASGASAVRPSSVVKVAGARIDRIMDTIGELVIAQARLDQLARRHQDPDLAGVVEELERLLLSLRDATLSIRMLPMESVFGKFRRVVRDLSEALGKNVELETLGGDTEIDKNVLDCLTDPLVHIIRNSLDHGLEAPETRQAAGKPRTGRLRLAARQEGGEVILEIADDGRGLDAEAIRRRAVERGLIDPDAVLAEADVHALIFAAGFSTAREVSDVSGRGVGMDVVRRAVEELRGQIDIASRPGRGTRLTLRLPVSLAIVEGLRVRLGERIFVIPLSAVDECVEIAAAEQRRRSGRRMLEIREDLIPFVPLEEALNLPAGMDGQAVRRVVVTRQEGQRVGFVVDDILGQAQTVIKPLSRHHAAIPGLSGATILGDGSVALILDMAALAGSARPGDLRPAA